MDLSCVSTADIKIQKNNAKINILYIAVDDLNYVP